MPRIADRELTDEEMKNRIHLMTMWAIRDGVLVEQPCEVCGFSGDEVLSNGVIRRAVSAHHDDYNCPLTVRWLCRTHHRRWHDRHQAVELSPEKILAFHTLTPREIYMQELKRLASNPAARRIRELAQQKRGTDA